MAEPFIAEIRIFSFNFAPRGWALCNGQLMPISQSTTLFALLGTNYGGDGRTTFALPNLQGRAPMHQGQGTGLTPRTVGESDGNATVSLLTTESPTHSHALMLFSQSEGIEPKPTGAYVAGSPGGYMMFAEPTDSGPYEMMNPMQLTATGSSMPHNNMMPYTVLNFCIALEGIWPSRQ